MIAGRRAGCPEPDNISGSSAPITAHLPHPDQPIPPLIQGNSIILLDFLTNFLQFDNLQSMRTRTSSRSYAPGDIEARMSAARILLMREAPFFGSLASRLRPVADPAIRTMGVMASGLMPYCPDFVGTLPLLQLAGSFAHEVLHLAGDVFGRCGTRDPYTFNIAHDLAINPLVLKSNLALPQGALLDPQYYDMAAEEIYERIKSEMGSAPRAKSKWKLRGNKNPFGAPGVGCADHGDPRNRRYREQGPVQGEMSPEAWRAAIAEAAEYARSMGKLPADVARWVGELFEPKLDWRVLLERDAHAAFNESETTWKRPSRRGIACGYRLPGRRWLGCEATIALDTSASIQQAEMTTAASEAEGILTIAGAALTVFCCDAAIATEIEARSIRDVTIKGGGGTSFIPVFSRIAERGREGKPCRLLVYFTDLLGVFPAEVPNYRVIWCVPKSLRGSTIPPPFGQVLFF